MTTRYRCLLCGLPGIATDPCARRLHGEEGALRRHLRWEHDVRDDESARAETRREVDRVVWRLPDGRDMLEAVEERMVAR